MNAAFLDLARTQLVGSAYILAALALFILGSRALGCHLQNRFGQILFATLNFVCVFLFFREEIANNKQSAAFFVCCVIVLYALLWAVRNQLDRRWRIPFFAAIGFLASVKLLPQTYAHNGMLPVAFIGISYLSLRLSYLVVEVRNGTASFPSLAQYLSFAFFLPTMNVGPISPYATYLQRHQLTPEQRWNAFVRIFVGLGKYQVLGVVFLRLTFAKLWGDEYRHAPIDYLVSAMAQYLYLYCNFSGFCDMMIGVANLAGFTVKENFNHPLKARNIKDFWNRWHISLSEYMRDVVFTPLSKKLVEKWGPARINEVIAVASLAVFFLIGIWHGLTWNFFWNGMMNAAGLIIVQYYTSFLRKKFPSRFKAYNQNRAIYFIAWAITFVYVSFSQALFACSMSDLAGYIRQIGH